jgi:hypothetical protein
MTNGAARKRAVVEVVASAHFHLVMGRKQDKYFSIDTEYGSTVMQSLTAGNIGKLLKNFFKTYIVGIKLQRDENGEECASRCEGLGKDTAARQLLDEAVFLCHSMVQGDTDSLAPSSAGLETAKKPKRPSGHGAKSKTNASEKGFSGNIAKKAKRESWLLAEAAREEAAIQVVREMGADIAKATTQGNEIFASLIAFLADCNKKDIRQPALQRHFIAFHTAYERKITTLGHSAEGVGQNDPPGLYRGRFGKISGGLQKCCRARSP